MSKAENASRTVIGETGKLVAGTAAGITIGAVKGAGDIIVAGAKSDATKAVLAKSKIGLGWLKDKTINLIDKVQVATTTSMEEKEDE